MTQEQLTVFLTNTKGNSSLQEQLRAAADVNAVAAIAKEAGFRISAESLNKVQPRLSDDELEGVAGGFKFRSVSLDATCATYCRCIFG